MAGRIAVIAAPLAAGAVVLLTVDTGHSQGEDQIQFNNHCRTCHSVDEGDHRLGPSLHDVVGREAGSLEGFAYSDAMRSSDVVWDAETLDRFVENPDAVVPGNTMKPFTGIADAEVRAAIVGYLQAESGG